jgi:uncharacterized protein YcaQ
VPAATLPRLEKDQVVRLWLKRQGLHRPRGATKLTRKTFVEHLERTGGVQLDSVNALERAHYTTLWSRFGGYDRAIVDRWAYEERLANEFIAHEACLVPASRLPLDRRFMRDFDPQNEWFRHFKVDERVKRRVADRIRREGPLESADFKQNNHQSGAWWGWKEEKLALEWLYRRGRLAVTRRNAFRRVYDLAARVYPKAPLASRREYEDSWLFVGLSGNGVAPERHLHNYMTAPRLKAPARREVVARNLKAKRIVAVEVEGLKGPCYATPETLDRLRRLPEPEGTHLLCPFDSLLWQRDRAEDLLGFNYRIEIYVPAPKRVFGYYVLPVLHDGRLVARVDPKFDRKAGRLQIRAIHVERGVKPDARFKAGLADALRDLADWLGAEGIDLPRGWGRLL